MKKRFILFALLLLPVISFPLWFIAWPIIWIVTGKHIVEMYLDYIPKLIDEVSPGFFGPYSRHTMKKLIPLILIVAMLAGCMPIVAHDPANQQRIDALNRIHTIDQAYIFTEREVTDVYRSGAISLDADKSIIEELQHVVRPLIEAAKSATVDGDFTTATAKVDAALSAVAGKLTKATTKPSR